MNSNAEFREGLSLLHVSPQIAARPDGAPPKQRRARWLRRRRPAYQSPYDEARAAERERQVGLMGGVTFPPYRPGP